VGYRTAAHRSGIPCSAVGVGSTGRGQAGVDGWSGGSSASLDEENAASSVRVPRITIRARALWSSIFHFALCIKTTLAWFTDANTLVLATPVLPIVTVTITHTLVLAAFNGVSVRNEARKTATSGNTIGRLTSGIGSTSIPGTGVAAA